MQAGAFRQVPVLIAAYGVRACPAQDLTQIYEAYGRNESITSNCDTKVALAPNNIETAEELSKLVGSASVRPHRTSSANGASISESEVARPLTTSEEVRRLGVGDTLILARGQRPRDALLRYYEQPYFKRLTAIKPPSPRDTTVANAQVTASREHAKSVPVADPPTSDQVGAPDGQAREVAGRPRGERDETANQAMRFLRFATEPQKSRSDSAPLE